MISPDNKLHRVSRQGRYKHPKKEETEPKKEDKKYFSWDNRKNLLFDPEYKAKKK